MFYDRNGVIVGFYVSSGYARNRILYRIELKAWLAYMAFAGKDYIMATSMYADEDKRIMCSQQKTRLIAEKNIFCQSNRFVAKQEEILPLCEWLKRGAYYVCIC